MRSQLGETFRVLGLTGQVVSRTDSSALVEFGGLGWLSVFVGCEGTFDGVITLSAPRSMLAPEAIGEVRRQVCIFFDLDHSSRIAIKLCEPMRFDGGGDVIYQAELADEPALPSGYPDWPSVYAAPPAAVRRSSWERTPEYKAGAFVRSFRDYLEAEPEEELYSVPRRYDLASMFAISIAYAMLFSVMRAMDALPLTIFLAGIFCAVVGAAQAIMFGGKKPREASIIAGAVAGFVCVVAFGLIQPNVSPAAIFSVAISSIVIGPILGYFAGTMIGGIWLIADHLRKWLDSRHQMGQDASKYGTEKAARSSSDSESQPRHALDD